MRASALPLVLVVVMAVGACGDAEPDAGRVSSTTGVTSVPGSPSRSGTTEPMPSIPPVAEGVRYLDPIFEAIETIENVVYWPDALPLPELTHLGMSDRIMDVHLPAGDVEDGRPVIVAFDQGADSWVVVDYVRRGYVVVTPALRSRPASPSADSFDLTRQGMVDGAAVVRWLRANADELRLHRDAIATTGASGAGIVAAALAWGQRNSPTVTEVDIFGVVTVAVPGEVDFGDHLAKEPSDVAAVFSMLAWYPPELVDRGEPPALFFNGTEDPTIPFGAVERICPAAQAVGVTCILRTFPTGHSVGPDEVLSVESAAFLYEHMLAPLGVVDPASLPVAGPDPAALVGFEPVRITSSESRPDPESGAGGDRDPEGLAIAPDGVIYVFGSDAIVAFDASGEQSTVELDGLPEGRPTAEHHAAREISDIAVDGDGTLWVSGSSYSSPSDESLGGAVFTDWFGDEIRQLDWIAARRCDDDPCSWDVWSPDDPRLATGGLHHLAIGVQGPVAATTDQRFDGVQLVLFDDAHWTTLPLPSVVVVDSVAVAGDGVVWITAAVGGEAASDPAPGPLMSAHGQTIISHTAAEGFPGETASGVAIAGDGTLWAIASGGPAGGGSIVSFDGAMWTIHDLGDDAPRGDGSFATGPDETVWALLPDRYARYDDDQWETWPTDLPTRGDADVAPDGTLWRTVGAVVVSFDGSDEIVYPSPFAD